MTNTVYTQIIENKFNISINYSTGTIYGQEVLKDGSFLTPSLYSNFNTLKGLSIKGYYKTGSVISIGAGLNYSTGSGWQSSQYNDYNGSRIAICSVSPVFRVHNKFYETGLFNTLTLSVEISPDIGFSNLLLSQPIFEIYSKYNSVSPPMKSRNILYGFTGSTGIEYAINQVIGINFAYSVSYNFIESKFYNDTHFLCSELIFGVIIKLKKDKRYFY